MKVRPAAGRISEWTGLDPSACFGVSLFRHEIVGYKGQGLVRERNSKTCGRVKARPLTYPSGRRTNLNHFGKAEQHRPATGTSGCASATVRLGSGIEERIRHNSAPDHRSRFRLGRYASVRVARHDHAAATVTRAFPRTQPSVCQ